MRDDVLFIDSIGQEYTRSGVLDVLHRIGADECSMLFVHTDIMFGRPNPKLKRNGYLDALFQLLRELSVPLIFPAFTYSFCNHEDFDVRNSRTSMGALNEFARKHPDARRTLDPLLSFAVIGTEFDQSSISSMDNSGVYPSLGAGSGFDFLHQFGGAKFLFFGADICDCFTYTHHIEKLMDVPYRFDMVFSGTIIDEFGNRIWREQSIHTKCGGIRLNDFSEVKRGLTEKGYLKAERLGDREVACIAEADVYLDFCRRLQENPFTFVLPFTEEDLTHEYTQGKNGERVTHC